MREDAVALQVDDLLGLRDREGNRIFFALMGIGPNEAVRLHALGGVLFDDPGGLVEAVRSVWRRPDAVTLVSTAGAGGPSDSRPSPPARRLHAALSFENMNPVASRAVICRRIPCKSLKIRPYS